jgi:pimeloyl-ACP methyl ester carboxylesterase
MRAVAERHAIDLPDGRRLEFDVAGPADGTVLFLHHGTPQSGASYQPWADAGAARGIRHVSHSRPGYAGSTRHPGRTIADVAADTAAIADALGAERFYVAGTSGGGPHALACAALLAERVIAAASIAGVGPYRVPDLDFLAGMGQENIEEFGAALEGESVLRPLLEAWTPELVANTPEHMVASLGDLVGEADRRALTGEFAGHLLAGMRDGLANGVDGWLDDDLAFCAPWGFGAGDITVPVAVWQGGDDRFVPLAHGEWLASHIAGATAHLLPEHGHISLQIDCYGDILDGLAAAGG